jgi:uncharacterized membrane protein YjfL (UPF0719 family)
MPYFFILPAFVLYVGGLVAAIVVSSLYPPAAFLRRYLMAALLWSTIGFIVSTAAYVIAFVASVGAMSQLINGGPSVAGGVAMGLMVFVAPFVAAAIGVIGGTAYGVWRTHRMVRAAA